MKKLVIVAFAAILSSCVAKDLENTEKVGAFGAYCGRFQGAYVELDVDLNAATLTIEGFMVTDMVGKDPYFENNTMAVELLGLSEANTLDIVVTFEDGTSEPMDLVPCYGVNRVVTDG